MLEKITLFLKGAAIDAKVSEVASGASMSVADAKKK